MKPTNEERREVAERLRKTPDIDDISQDELMYVLDDKLGNNLNKNGADEYEICESVVKRIADLIEPEPERTCKREKLYDAGGEWYIGCSKCRNPIEDFDVFCSHCGAKVVEE